MKGGAAPGGPCFGNAQGNKTFSKISPSASPSTATKKRGQPLHAPWIEDMAAHSDRVLVFEACHPGYHYVIRRKGSIRVKVVAHGQSAHAGGVPQKGVKRRPGTGAPGLPNSMSSTIRIPASPPNAPSSTEGDCLNVVPDRAEAEVDVRVGTREESEKVKAFFKALPDTAMHPDASIEIILDEQRPPPWSAPPASEALWEIVRKQAKGLALNPEAIGFRRLLGRQLDRRHGHPHTGRHGPRSAQTLTVKTNTWSWTASFRLLPWRWKP